MHPHTPADPLILKVRSTYPALALGDILNPHAWETQNCRGCSAKKATAPLSTSAALSGLTVMRARACMRLQRQAWEASPNRWPRSWVRAASGNHNPVNILHRVPPQLRGEISGRYADELVLIISNVERKIETHDSRHFPPRNHSPRRFLRAFLCLALDYCVCMCLRANLCASGSTDVCVCASGSTWSSLALSKQP